MKILQALYTFLVGDLTILVGVLLTVLVLGLIEETAALAALRPAAGGILILSVLAVLCTALYRETHARP